MHKICAINIRPEDKESIEYIKKIIQLLIDKGLTVLLPEYTVLKEADLSHYIADQHTFVAQPDIIFSIGGDGTLLHTARLFAGTGKPIFGINKGRLGFLTEFMPEEAIGYLDIIIRKNYEKTERDMLELIQIRDKKEIARISLLNDVAISRGTFSRPIVIHLEIDGKYLNSFSGDGLIIATSTGSTAYSLSAGGPIITPTIKDILLIMPICPHTLATRPLIIPGSSKLKVTIGSKFGNTIMTIDGHESINITGDDEIYFSETDKKAILIAHPHKNFYEILKQKFNWGSNAFA
ncbi:MAG: NAD(+)/NADH kinase [Spirochaetes bacterium]|nr:NAD(+)/NADH kinase [Spirochaetota bacterium]